MALRSHEPEAEAGPGCKSTGGARAARSSPAIVDKMRLMPSAVTQRDVLLLQRVIGNEAVQCLLDRSAETLSVQRIGPVPAANLDPADYLVPQRDEVIEDRDRSGILYKIILRHKHDRRRDLMVHVHHHPMTPRGINVRYRDNDNESKPANAAIDNFIGQSVGL